MMMAYTFSNTIATVAKKNKLANKNSNVDLKLLIIGTLTAHMALTSTKALHRGTIID